MKLAVISLVAFFSVAEAAGNKGSTAISRPANSSRSGLTNPAVGRSPHNSGRTVQPRSNQFYRPATPRRSMRGGGGLGAGIPLRRSVFVSNLSFAMDYQSKKIENCPSYFTAVDEREPNATHPQLTEFRGEAPMRWFVSDVRLTHQSKTSAEWKGRLIPEFADCKANAFMTAWANRTVPKKFSHISLEFRDGFATLTADYSQYKGAKITSAGLDGSGRPRWRWEMSAKND